MWLLNYLQKAWHNQNNTTVKKGYHVMQIGRIWPWQRKLKWNVPPIHHITRSNAGIAHNRYRYRYSIFRANEITNITKQYRGQRMTRNELFCTKKIYCELWHNMKWSKRIPVRLASTVIMNKGKARLPE
jgi:hypothetical protein